MSDEIETHSSGVDDSKPLPLKVLENDFINSRPFIRSKIVNGKLNCDRCKNPFPAILPFYITINDSNEELLCHPCSYKRGGMSVEEFYKSKRKDGEQIANMKEQRMEHSKAYQIAKSLIVKLSLYCERVEIAGSLRRKKPDVKDIELCVLPKTIEEQDGFFDSKKVRSPEFISAVNGLGKIIKGKPEDGRYVQIELSDGLKLDLFIPQEIDYWRQFVIRSGSADYVKKHIAGGWSKNGWCGTEGGLRLIDECEAKKDKDGKITKWVCIADNPTLPPVWKSEREFFEFLSVPYAEPENRIR